MALSQWPTIKALETTTNAETDSIRSARADINQTIQNVNGIIDSLIIGSPTHGQVLFYDSTQDALVIGDQSYGFKNIAVSGQNSIVADSAEDTLTIVAGTNMTITTDAATDTITFAAAGGSGGGIALNDLSVGAEGTASGDGGLSYNNTTGVFTYTPPTLAGLNGSIGDLSDVDTSGIANEKILKYNSTSGNWEIASEGGGAAGNPAGSDTQIQYNDNGSFGADQFFTLKNPGGGSSCTLNHKGHINVGFGVTSASAITASDPEFYITQSSSSRTKWTVRSYTSTDDPSDPERSGRGSGGAEQTLWGADGWIGIYPESISFGTSDPALTLKKTSTGDLQTEFRSSGTGSAVIIMDDLPTSDPVVAGQLWNDNGTLKISAG